MLICLIILEKERVAAASKDDSQESEKSSCGFSCILVIILSFFGILLVTLVGAAVYVRHRNRENQPQLEEESGTYLPPKINVSPPPTAPNYLQVPTTIAGPPSFTAQSVKEEDVGSEESAQINDEPSPFEALNAIQIINGNLAEPETPIVRLETAVESEVFDECVDVKIGVSCNLDCEEK